MRVRLPAGGRIAPLDPGGRNIRLLTAAVASILVFAASAAGSVTELRLRALIWIAPGQEVAALTRQPAMCPKAGTADAQTKTGEALFNAPMLLGGQAARADISCASCHSNGRRNPHFHLEGVSDDPGTADVSSSFFSPARANQVFDPKPIPDLAFPGKISRDPASGDLERFLRGLIVEEFSGRPPPDAVIKALATYVRTIGDCGPTVEAPRRLADQVNLIQASVSSAARLAHQGDTETAAILVTGARHQLGLISERYVGRNLGRERKRLLAASRALQPSAQSGAPNPDALKSWLAMFERNVLPGLQRSESRSLYNAQQLPAEPRWRPAR